MQAIPGTLKRENARRTPSIRTAVALLALLCPAALAGQARILDVHAALPNLDARTGSVAPSPAQRSAVSALGASVRWNRFGTPASLVRHGEWLSAALPGDAASAARAWVLQNRGLFRLSEAGVAALETVSASRLAGGAGHVVLLRQTYGGIPAAHDGLIAVAIRNGRVAYVSSSATGDGGAPGAASLSPQAAWLRAAANVGRTLGPSALSNVRLEHDWTVFAALGFSEPQRTRLRALAAPGGAVRPVYEANVVDVDGGIAAAYTVFVDAGSGAVLMRHNRTNQLAAAPAAAAPPAPTTSQFSGEFTETACGTPHPFDVPAGTTQITVAATATLPANDIVLKLLFDGRTVSTSADAGTSPEVINYVPPPSTLPGVYSVQVCPFAGALFVPPLTYSGTVTLFDSQPVIPYPPKWQLFTANPALDLSATDVRKVACWVAAAGGLPCDLLVQNVAARFPWDVDTRTNLPTFTTKGNAASTAQAWVSPLTPAEQVRPVSASREYAFPWTNQWQETGCSPAAFASASRNDTDAATANLFAMHNRMHDWSWFLGFTEESFNLQDNNFGNFAPGLVPISRENDPEWGNVQAGAVSGGTPSFQGRDNANQITLQDGIPGITNMYLWQPIAAAFYPPCVDGDFDMSVIGHEYTHAISNRMVGGPDGSIVSDQGGAMGESWSDLNAVEYLNAFGFVPTGGENPFSVGAYVTGNPRTGIRNYAMNASPLNYSDVGYDFVCNTDLVFGLCISRAQVHADGEIWSAVNYDLRDALVRKYNGAFPASNRTLQKECAEGKRDASQCPGNRRWIQLVHDAFLMLQSDLSMLDARDALLAADVLRFGGANQRELWDAFARRGFGQFASAVDGEDPDPVPSFESPVDANEGTLTFKTVAKDEGNAAVQARIYVGRYEAGATPAADTFVGTALGNQLKLVSGTYEFVVQAEGYGLLRLTRTVQARKQVTVTVAMPTNWASRFKGATVSGDGINLGNLIDDTEATNWARLLASPTPAVEGVQATVKLPGAAKTVRRVQVSAMLRPIDDADPGGDTGGQNRFSALRSFEIWTCRESLANAGCTAPTAFTKIYTSPADFFPAGRPRPNAPDLIARAVDVPATVATHVRLRVLANQCTGGPAYQGDQDADPLNDTDCVTGSNSPARRVPQGGNVRAAELQVFSSTP
ncbi:MAG TPA: M36 family metallopeptidase [Gemmatimonadota bacterium]|jgi:hypothetical protein